MKASTTQKALVGCCCCCCAALAAFFLLGLLPGGRMAPPSPAPAPQRFEFYSRPVELAWSEVHNKLQAPIALPPGLAAYKKIGIKNYNVDIVGKDAEGNEFEWPLYDGYNHHYGMLIGSMEEMKEIYSKLNDQGGQMHFRHLKEAAAGHNAVEGRRKIASFGGGSGAEERHTPHAVPAPFAWVVDGPEAFMPLIHLINTRNTSGDLGYSPLAECPCTPQRTFDAAKGLIDGKPPQPPFACNDAFRAQGNPSCFIEKYEGGYRCCEHGVFLRDTDKYPHAEGEEKTTFFFKFTVDVVAVADEVVPVRTASCCDVTGNMTHFGNIEYDIPQCAEGTPKEECVHFAVTRQPIDMALGGFGLPWEHETIDPNAEIDIVQATGHLHLGGLSLDLYEDATGRLICASRPKYGHSESAGDEQGYLVGMTPCVFRAGEMRLKRSSVVRIEAKYDASVGHHGVMSLALVSVADVAKPPAA